MKNINKSAFIFLVAIGMIVVAPSAALALTTESSGTSAGGSSLTTSDSGSSAGTNSALSTSGSDTSAGNTPSLTTSGSDTSAGNTPALTTSGSDTSAGNTPALTTSGSDTSAGNTGGNTNTGGSNTGGNTNTGGSNNQSSGGNSGPGNPNNGGSYTGGGTGYASGSGSIASTCYLISTNMKAGDTGTEVTKLQNFLKSQGFQVTVTGTFDAQTVASVKAFQAKFASEILAPWGVTTPTGNVFMTTMKKINSISCKTPLTLTPAELALLNARKAAAVESHTPVTEVIGSNTGASSEIGGEVIVGGTSTDTTQVASAGQSAWKTFWMKVWNFIKRIFGR